MKKFLLLALAIATPITVMADHHGKHHDDDHEQSRHQMVSSTTTVEQHQQMAMKKAKMRYDKTISCLEMVDSHEDIKKCMHPKGKKHDHDD